MKKTFGFCLLILSGFILFAQNEITDSITVLVAAGENWKAKMNPQFAVWLETEDGSFIKTLYVTKKAGSLSWIMSPKSGRPESLPVWYNVSKNKSAKNQNLAEYESGLDAVTSATPKGGIIFKSEKPAESCVIKAEFNTSFDYNETFTKKNSGVNGQPSVIYSAKIPAYFSSEEEIRLEFSGYGALDGSNGKITGGTDGLTTALSIVKMICVK